MAELKEVKVKIECVRPKWYCIICALLYKVGIKKPLKSCFKIEDIKRS